MSGTSLKRWFGAAGVGALSLVLASCSTGRYEPIPETGATLTGTVTYKKELLKAGLVLVQGKGAGANGEIGEDGRYEVKNVPLGDVTVAVNLGAARGKLIGQAAANKAQGGKAPEVKLPNIPGKYADVATSPLKTTVNKGQNTFDIVID